MKTITIIGFGNMGSAMLKGISLSMPDFRLQIIEKDIAKSKAACESFNATLFDSVSQISKSDIIILAVKPYDAESVLSELSATHFKGIVISILAGKTTQWIAERSACNSVARFMPSLAASAGKGAVGVCYSNALSIENRKLCLAIAGSLGQPYEIAEQQMHAITGLSGSGIAFGFAFLHGLAMGGVSSGLPYPQALQITLDMVEGAAALIRQTGTNPVEMISKVCSPAGTTIRGMYELEKGGFTALCMAAVQAAADRSSELEN